MEGKQQRHQRLPKGNKHEYQNSHDPTVYRSANYS